MLGRLRWKKETSSHILFERRLIGDTPSKNTLWPEVGELQKNQRGPEVGEKVAKTKLNIIC